MKKLFSLIIGILLSASAAYAANPADISTFTSIAALRVVPVAAGPQYPNVQVVDYYGTGAGCPIQYKWNASDNTADNGGSVINPTGNGGVGRWNMQLAPGAAPRTCQWGVKIDSLVNNPTQVTNNYTQMQRLLDWSFNSGPNVVQLDTVKGSCIGFGTTLVPHEGEIIRGNGELQTSSLNPGNSCLAFYGNSGPAILLQTPYPGNGQTPFESPKFSDFNIYISINNTNTSASGCIQLNSIAGGFLDDPTTQQAIQNVTIVRINCLMGFALSNQIGLQCSKCFDGVIESVQVSFGGIGVDLEGSDNLTIQNSRILQPYTNMLRLASQNTFGNLDTIRNNEFLSMVSSGQSVDSMLFDTLRSSSIYDNQFENAALPDANVTSVIHLSNGFNAGIHDNVITLSSVVHWLKVDTAYNNITAINNGSEGALIGNALFSTTLGKYWYAGGVRQSLVHFGNGMNGDYGWPFNSKLEQEQILFPKVRQVWTPSTPGLTFNGYGATEAPTSNDFTIPTTGSGNFLQFAPDSGYTMTGTFDLGLFAWQTSGAGQETCQIEDNGSLVGSPIVQATTATPTWYVLAFNQAVATQAGARCWNSGTGTGGNPALIGQVNLQDH